MLRPIDEWYLQKDEPIKSCFQFLRTFIIKLDPRISEAWKYGMPFFCCNGKMLCYLWVHKKYKQPYLGIVEGKKIDHSDLLVEKRSRMKILLIDPDNDMPVRKISKILTEVLKHYK